MTTEPSQPTTPRPAALLQNLELLDQGIHLLAKLSDDLYTEPSAEPGFRQTPGPHLRHTLDAYNCLLDGLENGLIDYDARSRSRAVETSRREALAAIEHTRAALEAVETPTQTRLEILVDIPGDGDDAPAVSSLGREYQFLVGHTIHHYALIAMILRQRGWQPDAEFGVAPSTLRHWRESGG